MIKILHIAKPIGGVGVYIQLLTKHLQAEEFCNVLLCNKDDKITTFKNSLEEKIETFHINLNREIKPLSDIKCLIDIIKKIRKIKPDIIHCHSAKAGILGRLVGTYLKIPTLYTPHAYSYLSTNSKLKKHTYKQIEKAFKFSSAKTLCCSLSEYNRTVNDLNFNKKNVLLWNNSIEDVANVVVNESGYNLPQKYICTIGRPSYQKNTELLINTIVEIKKQRKDIHLVVLGVGFYSPSLVKIKELIKNKNLESNITLVEWIERKKALSILKQADLYISTSRYEGLPYAVIEALALGKPCVVTNVDGNKDLIEDNFNGFKVKKDKNEIVDKVLTLINNEEERERMGVNSRKYFEESFKIEKNIGLLEEIYKSMK
ncbi:glycosyltransferase family 1 protein [Tenacibaculum sp. E3R01]|uniref:glycosyltransferase n=1 Tax=Tenacibaculum sp. E3R01 TaxID=2267227 RepID=UPI000DE8D0DC|nr:glycosyltransferase [Tenacibaculum sp. E3R01]RBW59604.1 glycosyltransferase family 1 protein [Tenacibaculum sp. E3R01]